MLKKTFFIVTTILCIAISGHISASNINLQAQDPEQTEPVVTKEITEVQPDNNTSDKPVVYKDVAPLKLVAQPDKYLNKKIKFNAKFDKFSAIGLDYEPINRDSKKYISFLIKRENVTSYNIPLSELKLILKRDYAEKELVNLESGDEIEVFGNVFATALGDPWVDVDKITILTHKNTDKNVENKDNTANTVKKDNESNEGK